MKPAKNSVCNSKKSATYGWFGSELGNYDCSPIEYAASVFEKVVVGNAVSYVSEMSLAMWRREFVDKIKRAEEGKLFDPWEVRHSQNRVKEPLFEIRWQNQQAMRMIDGELVTVEIHVRHYQSESVLPQRCFTGHLIREKTVVPNDQTKTVKLQDEDIDTAAGYYRFYKSRP